MGPRKDWHLLGGIGGRLGETAGVEVAIDREGVLVITDSLS